MKKRSKTKSSKIPLFLSDEQLAKRYGVSRSTIWRWLRKGDFPSPVKLGPGCTRWPLDDVQAWEAEKQKQYDMGMG